MDYEEWVKDINSKAALAVKRMTAEEKTAAMTTFFHAVERLGIPAFGIGTEAACGIQARHDQSFDRGEPVFTTVLPSPTGMSSTWDREIMKKAGYIVGTEMRALYNSGKGNSLTVWAPTVDMERDPRWGRNEESYGEDPFLTSEIAGSYITGIHGDDKTGHNSCAAGDDTACIHFSDDSNTGKTDGSKRNVCSGIAAGKHSEEYCSSDDGGSNSTVSNSGTGSNDGSSNSTGNSIDIGSISRTNDRRCYLAAVTAKHFYCNNTENGRTWKSSDISEKLKWEYYLEVYRRLIVYYHTDSLMAAYNSVNGVPNIANPDINDILKNKWHLQMILSDGSGVMTAVNPVFGYKDYEDVISAAVPAGMDIFTDDADKVKTAVRDALLHGRITQEQIDRAVTDHLSMFLRTGKIDIDESGNCHEISSPYDDISMNDVNTEESRMTVKKLTEETAVLLKNTDNALPLKKEQPYILAGPLCDLHAIGWYSGISDRMVTLRDALGKDAEFTSDLLPVVRIRLGRDIYIGYGDETDMDLIGNRNPENVSYRIRPVSKKDAALFRIMMWDDGKITFRATRGNRLLTVDHSRDNSQFLNEEDGKRLFIAKDEAFGWFVKEVFYLGDENGKRLSFDDTSPELADGGSSYFWESPDVKRLLTWDEKTVGVNRHGHIRILDDEADDNASFAGSVKEDNGKTMISDNANENAGDIISSDNGNENGRALSVQDFGIELVSDPLADVEEYLKKNSETKVIAAFGTHPVINCKEDRDRESIAFPPYERSLIKRLSKVSAHIELVLMTNYPVAVGREQSDPSVSSILWTATGSEEYGNAVKSLIFGNAVPSGCLSMTWYDSDRELGSIDDYDIEKKHSTYLYADRKPLYNFGYGLSYTSFKIRSVSILRGDENNCSKDESRSSDSYPDVMQDTIDVLAELENTGECTGSAVIQVYIKRNGTSAQGKKQQEKNEVMQAGDPVSSGTNEGSANHDDGARVCRHAALLNAAGPAGDRRYDVFRLKGFERAADLAPGEIRQIKIRILRDDLRYYDSGAQESIRKEGNFTMCVCTGSGNGIIREFTVE